MNDGGWIKIHKSIFNNPWMFRPNVLTIWVYILCHVNYRPTDAVFEGKRITLQPGQGIFKIREIAKIFRVSSTSIHRIIVGFKNEAQIETQSSPRNTIITVVNWQKYQSYETQDETQLEHKRNTSETQTEHLPISKRIKELKNERNNINNPNGLFPTQECEDEQKSGDFQEIIDKWNELPVAHIREIKGNRLKMLRARVNDYGVDGVIDAISMIRHSAFLLGQNKNGWQIVFDWFIKPNNFIKVYEGNYDDRQRSAPTGRNDMMAGFNEAMNLLGLEENNG